MSTSFASQPTPNATSWPLPRGLREEAEDMSTDALQSIYAPTSGPLRLGHWECADTGRRGPQARRFRATIAVGDRIDTATASASGPIGALTEMLHDRGIAVEVREFHQMPLDGVTATFVRGTDGRGERWAMGMARDSTDSGLRAVVACANRLYAGRA